MSCCPASAWGELKNPSYQPKGTVEEFEGMRFYRSGNSHKCIIWNYDVFGFDGGRTKQMVDFIADNGYMVILPDYYAGKMINPMTSPKEELVEFVKKETDWEGTLKSVWANKIRPYAVNHGAKTFGAIGTCWGSYLVVKLSSDVDFKAGISMHPSHTPICAMLGVDEEKILKEVKCPQMFMPAGEDNENVKVGGLGQKVLADGVEIIEFPDMKHGWTVKGDLSVPEVDRDVKKTFNFVLTFFGKYLH